MTTAHVYTPNAPTPFLEISVNISNPKDQPLSVASRLLPHNYDYLLIEYGEFGEDRWYRLDPNGELWRKVGDASPTVPGVIDLL